MHLNVQSISNKLDTLELFLESEQPDVFCVSEHHLHHLQVGLVGLKGYKLGNYYCRTVKSKGGVAIYVKSGILFREINLSRYVVEIDCELTAVQIQELDLVIITV